MIKVTDLSKIFRTEEIETTALNGVSFEIKEGEFVAIMGPSGCGKSTLLNILGLLDNPSGGSYELMGQEVAKLKERDRTRFRKGNIGFVFQSFNLIDELNVFENVELPLKYLNIGAGERKRRCPVVSSSVWQLRVPSFQIPNLYWPMNLPVILIPETVRKLWIC